MCVFENIFLSIVWKLQYDDAHLRYWLSVDCVSILAMALRMTMPANPPLQSRLKFQYPLMMSYFSLR